MEPNDINVEMLEWQMATISEHAYKVNSRSTAAQNRLGTLYDRCNNGTINSQFLYGLP